jgi:hypothetical protein
VARKAINGNAPSVEPLRVTVYPEDLARLDSLVEAANVKGVHGRNGETLSRSSVMRFAIHLLSQMSLEELARLYENVPQGPLAVWSAKPPPRRPRPPAPP